LTMSDLSIPRTIMWCKAPGMSKRARRGMECGVTLSDFLGVCQVLCKPGHNVPSSIHVFYNRA
jgi:hypothetical protein